jgi:hypothetical protein
VANIVYTVTIVEPTGNPKPGEVITMRVDAGGNVHVHYSYEHGVANGRTVEGRETILAAGLPAALINLFTAIRARAPIKSGTGF